MACSCKNKQKTTALLSSTQTTLLKTTVEEPKVLLVQPKKLATTIKSSFSVPKLTNLQYDFSANTKPLEVCTNCALKHISLALALLRTDVPLNRYIAVGLLMAASYHYNQALPKIAIIALQQAQTILVTNEVDLQAIQNLLFEASKATTDINAKKLLPLRVTYSPLEAMKHICLAYSLLFTEIFYLLINKGYVVGLLVLAALYLQLKDRPTARHLRLIWKVVQLIKLPNDLDYENSKAMLEQLMLSFNVNVQ